MVSLIKFDRLTLRDMMSDEVYHSLATNLIQLPVPDKIKIAKKVIDIPNDLKMFSDNLCYGQRLFLAEKESNDFGLILRAADGYFYPLVSGKKWDDDAALRFGRVIMFSLVKDIYPVAYRLISLLDELLKRERRLLHREPTSQEKQAGIDKLDKFSELSALKYLQVSMNKTREEVLLTPYNDCLVEFYLAKETHNFNDRLLKIQHPELYKQTK